MTELPANEVEARSIERIMRMTIKVPNRHDVHKLTARSKPAFNPQYLNLRFDQAGPGAKVVLTRVSVSGPRRLMDGRLSENTDHDITRNFYEAERIEVEHEGLEDFPDWVPGLVLAYWPAEL